MERARQVPAAAAVAAAAATAAASRRPTDPMLPASLAVALWEGRRELVVLWSALLVARPGQELAVRHSFPKRGVPAPALTH